jgi:hypothetical protein
MVCRWLLKRKFDGSKFPAKIGKDLTGKSLMPFCPYKAALRPALVKICASWGSVLGIAGRSSPAGPSPITSP